MKKTRIPSRPPLRADRLRESAAALSRRDFLQRGAGLGLAGMLPLLQSCGGSDDEIPKPTPEPPKGATRTLFFDLSAEVPGKTWYYHGGGQTLTLTAVADKPDVLAGARTKNRFLSKVPDANLTHHLEGVQVAEDSVTLSYLSADIDTTAGTWQMSSMFFQIPESATRVAFQRAQAKPATAATPTALRARFGLTAAQTEDEAVEELAMVDQTTHAATLIGLHPDIMGLEPTAAATVQSNHVGKLVQTTLLQRAINRVGTTASPQTTPGTPNATGWASLRPLTDSTGAPIRRKVGPNVGRLQYHTVLHPVIAQAVGAGAVAATQSAKDDEFLGADITTLQDPSTYTGKLWYRRDGRPNVDQTPSATPSPAAVGDDNIAFALKHLWPGDGLDVDATSSANSDGSREISVSFTNWYLRYLGAYVQFLDAGGTVLQLSTIDEYTGQTLFDASVGHIYRPDAADKGKSYDNADSVWLGLVPAINTIMGIPLETTGGAGSLSTSFWLPKSATTVRFLAGGMGTGSQTYPETLNDGIAMTAFFCYGITALCASAGAGTKYPIIIQNVATILGDVANNLAAFIVDKSSGADTSSFWSDQALALVETILGDKLPNVLATMVGIIIGIIAEAEVEDAIPIIGVVSQVISAAIGVADLILTTVDVATSPWTYVNDMTFTYDLAVGMTLTNSDVFPAGADAYTVTAMIDNGTPYTQTLSMPVPPPQTLPDVVFKGVPLGGTLNVSVSFQQTAITATAADIVLGRGSTGAVDNTGGKQSIGVERLQFPIDVTTLYKHNSKTFLDDNDQHLWAAAPAPTLNLKNAVCGAAGTICAHRGITVRQGTPTAKGYLGYAWQAQNSDPTKAPSCVGGTVGQLDQTANLATVTAQDGYAANGCGLSVGGVRVTYNLLSHGASNYYLDTTNANAPMVRRVVLDGTPQFDSPLSGQAWGVLNMASDMLVLHPAGHLVSINQTNHKIETHLLPASPKPDTDARVQLLAQPKSGRGTRPGRIDTPVGVAVTTQGQILVLEAGNNRVHALDLGANPVPLFSKQPSAYWLQLDQFDAANNWQHLDIAVEFTGFIYILSYDTVHFDYVLHIYHPSQGDTTPIALTHGFNAARIAVDFWRSVYALNYEVIPRSNPANTTPPPVTEPSVSLWTPCSSGNTC